MSNAAQLIERFVATFETFDAMHVDEASPAWQLAIERKHDDAKPWAPLKTITAPSLLEEVYAKLPGRFPPLYERLVLSYRWAEVDLGTYRLLANPPGPNLTGLVQQMSQDSGLWEALLPAGYVQFGRGPDIDYDPVCFDTNSQGKGGDCRIVKIDHEEILCNYRITVVAELSPSFEKLVLQTIKAGETKHRLSQT